MQKDDKAEFFIHTTALKFPYMFAQERDAFAMFYTHVLREGRRT